MSNIFFIIFIFGGLVLVYVLLKKELEKFIIQNKSIDSQRYLELQNQLLENFKLLKEEAFSHLKTTLEKQEKIIETTSKLEEFARNLESSTIEIKNLKEVFAGPKQRGYLGEIMLEEIIKNLPGSYYESQYYFGSERVDYVLKLNDILIPIDSKFPVQNYYKLFEEKDKSLVKKDLINNLKKQIEAISRKYILPLKGTVEFALMYLANESIYYEILSDKDYQEIWDYAREKSVFITSPKTFEIFCSSLLLVIRKQELSKNINQILANLHQLEKDLIEIESKFETAFNQINNSFKNIQDLARMLNRFIINFRHLIRYDKNLEGSKKI